MGIEQDQPSGGMSPGGNRLTQIPAARLFLDPSLAAQGRGFWTGKYNPKGKVTEFSEDPADLANLNLFQERGAEHEVVRYFENGPDEDEETIKSLSSEDLFDCATGAMEAGDIPAYTLFKGELEKRALLARVRKGPGDGKDSLQANRDKRVFNATHGVDDETSTEDKEELSVPLPVKKAIGTKSAEAREKPVKQARPPPKGKVTSTKNGKKNYDYRKPSPSKKPGSPPKSPTESGNSNSTGADLLEVKPERLADQLGIDVKHLQKLAEGKSEHEFISYLRAKGATFMAKHKVPNSYLSEVYEVLSRNSVGKSVTPKTPKAKLKAKGVTLVKKFTINPTKLKKGTEERSVAEQMLVSGVNTLGKLATFLAKGYDLSPKQATQMAMEFHSSLRSEGALS